MTTMALVQAAPERRRILRDLLNTPEPWTRAQRRLYDDMIRAEAQAMTQRLIEQLRHGDLEEDADDRKRRHFEHYVQGGVPVLDAMRAAERSASRPVKSPSYGDTERQRRAQRRQAVTALDGATAVTTGVIAQCIVCGKQITARRPHSWKRWRRDSAYDTNACRQKAYRERQRRESLER